MKVLILWSGAVVPAYGQFFRELAIGGHMQVRVLAPRRWTHGSKRFGGDPAGNANARRESGCEIIPVAYLTGGGSRYWVPSLLPHLWSFRPDCLYIMEEMDRPSLAWHALAARLAWPPVRVISYALQNLASPSYYRWHHRAATRLNQALVSRSIAASREAESVLRANGFRKPTRVIPLWGSEDFFHPGEKPAIEAYRRGLGMVGGETVLVYAGSMVEAKGLGLLKEVLPRFPRLRVVSAGNGPLGAALPECLGRQWIHLGALAGGDLRRLYQAGDYVILPSLTLDHWKEQIGRSLIEGILCGCLALGSDSGHIPELTLFPETTFRQGDAESLAGMLAGLPLPAPKALEVRAAQRANVEARFTASAVARLTGSFLREAAR